MTEQPKNPLKQITQPFIDVVHAPRALWGINFGYFLEGFVYFGMLNYLVMYFNEYVGLDDIWAGLMVSVLTAGITISMFLFGGLSDRWGIRAALIIAFSLMVLGRLFLAGAPMLGLTPDGLWSPIHLVAMAGIVILVLGYGMYEPAAYSGVRILTTPKTAAMGYAMLYALMNLGAWLPTFFSPIRNKYGIAGAYWILVGFTFIALIATLVLLTRKTVARTIAQVEAERAREEKSAAQPKNDPAAPAPNNPKADAGPKSVPLHLWLAMLVLVGCVYFLPADWRLPVWGVMAGGIVIFLLLPSEYRQNALHWLAHHPLADAKFCFFIFCLIPVQTLFVHNWLTLPMYVQRAFQESWPWISRNFEPAISFNPLLVFVLVPIATAMTQKRSVYSVMLLGTFIMAAPAFLLALGPTPWTLVSYLIIMTIGESIWQPRFLQYAAEIAPKDRVGSYIGVARLPWFLTKAIVPIYSGLVLSRYCPAEGPTETEPMWFIYGCIAMSSTVLLLLARKWIGMDLREKAA